jgi:hypothetical protein
MATPSRIKELLKKGSEEAVRKTGTSFADLSKTKKSELYRNVAGGSTTSEMINKGFTRVQIATAREKIRTAKGGQGAENAQASCRARRKKNC